MVLVPHFVLEHLSSHLLNGFGSEQWKWLRDTNGGYATAFRISKLFHGVQLRRWRIGKVLLRVKNDFFRD